MPAKPKALISLKARGSERENVVSRFSWSSIDFICYSWNIVRSMTVCAGFRYVFPQGNLEIGAAAELGPSVGRLFRGRNPGPRAAADPAAGREHLINGNVL